MSTLTAPAQGLGEQIIGDDELYEVIDGKRVRTRPMGVYSVWIATNLVCFLGAFARVNPMGRAITEGLFHLPRPIDRDRRPDVAFVSYQRWPATRSIPRLDNAWDVVPNLAVEVVSPSDTIKDLQEKIGEYFRSGVELVWVIYPLQSVIYVYESLTKIQVVTVTDTLDGGTVMPGFKLPLNELFTEPAENEPAVGNGHS